MLGTFTMRSRGKINGRLAWLGLSLATGLLLSTAMLGLILAGSDGTEPRGICKFVAGDDGFLPLNPNEGGTHSYSCNVNITLATFYIGMLGVLFSVFVFYGGMVFIWFKSIYSGLRAHKSQR